jgi:hypothetical protein
VDAGQLGFKCETHRKIYYVDGHANSETMKKYRKMMVSEYLKNDAPMDPDTCNITGGPRREERNQDRQ